MSKLFPLCQKDEISFDTVAKNGNNVEATFDFVERIVRLVAFDNVASTWLMVWTGRKKGLYVLLTVAAERVWVTHVTCLALGALGSVVRSIPDTATFTVVASYRIR